MKTTRRAVSSSEQPGFRLSFNLTSSDNPPKQLTDVSSVIERRYQGDYLETWSPVCLEGHQDIINCLLYIGSSRFEYRRKEGLFEKKKLGWGLFNSPTFLEPHRIASGSDDGTLIVWDIETQEIVTQIQAHRRAIKCMTLLYGTPVVDTEPETDPDQSQEESHDEDSRNSRSSRTSRGSDRSKINQTSSERQPSYLVTGSTDQTLKVWDLETFECKSTLKGHTGKVNCVIVLENITVSMIEGMGGNKSENISVVREAKCNTNDEGESNNNDEEEDNNNNNNNNINNNKDNDNNNDDDNDDNDDDNNNNNNSNNKDNNNTNNTNTNTNTNPISDSDLDSPTPNPNDPTAIPPIDPNNNTTPPFSQPTGNTSPPLFCSGGSDGRLIIWSIQGQEFQIQRQENEKCLNCLLQVQNYLITGSDAKYVLVYDLLTLSYKTLLSCHRDSVRCLMKVTDNFFLSGSLDGIIRMWDVNSFLPVVTLENPKEYKVEDEKHKFLCCPVYSVAPLFDDYFVAAIGKGFKVYDASLKVCVEQLDKVHKSVIVEVMPLMGGLEFVTSSEDSTIKIWSVISAPQKHQMAGGVPGGLAGDSFCVRIKTELVKHHMAVTKLCSFSELSFASGGADHKIYLWNHSGITSPKSLQRRSTMMQNRMSYPMGGKRGMKGLKKDYVVKKYNSFRVFEDYEPDEFHAVSVAYEKYSVSETILDYVKGLVYDKEVC